MQYTIAVDCDEVLVESAKSLLTMVKDIYGHDRPYSHMRHYMLSDNAHIPLDQQGSLDVFMEYCRSAYAHSTLPVVGAYETLHKWKQEGHKLYVLTARNEAQKPITERQIATHYSGIFEDIIYAHHYTQNHVPKSALCQSIGAGVLIEDNIDYALEVAIHAIPVFLLQKPWNAWRDENNTYIHRVTSWGDIDLSNVFAK